MSNKKLKLSPRKKVQQSIIVATYSVVKIGTPDNTGRSKKSVYQVIAFVEINNK